MSMLPLGIGLCAAGARQRPFSHQRRRHASRRPSHLPVRLWL